MEQIATVPWKNASTYPDAPHEYILREREPECFAYFTEKLKTEGISEPFTLRGYTRTYRYYYYEGYRYWTIQNVLNRCRVIDTSFNFTKDAGGRDPDQYSSTLCRYHRLLWSRNLPSGKLFKLVEAVSDGKHSLHHRSELGDFILTSDSITHSYRDWKRLKHVIEQVPKEEIESFRALGYTIGGMLVWPGNMIDGQKTINGERGCNSHICDRFDLTLECVRRYYIGQSSPLADVFRRYDSFLALFEDFRGYVDYFLLQDLVAADYSAVTFFMPFDDFRPFPVPTNVDAYKDYRRRNIEFLNARNRRIDDTVTEVH